jgi:hypothetical protein
MSRRVVGVTMLTIYRSEGREPSARASLFTAQEGRRAGANANSAGDLVSHFRARPSFLRRGPNQEVMCIFRWLTGSERPDLVSIAIDSDP